MLRILVLSIVVLMSMLLPAVAKDTPSEACLRGFLADTAYAVPAKATSKDLADLANEMRLELGLEESLPTFTTETQQEWCDFVSGAEGQAVRQLAQVRAYPITLKGLEEIDDGIGPLPFNFKPYPLATRYDGLTCEYAITKPGFIASGLFDIKGGHLIFHDNTWRIGRGTEQEAFDRFNLAITEKGALVGKIIFWLHGADEGETQHPLQTSVFKPGKETLGADMPIGRARAITQIGEGAWFNVLRCAKAGEPMPEQYAFDFSKYKIDEKLDNLHCVILVNHPEGFNGYFDVSVSKGYATFTQAATNTGGPYDSLRRANLAFTKDRHIVGLFEAWWMFQVSNEARPPALIYMEGTDPIFDKSLTARMELRVDSAGKLLLRLQDCAPTKK